jgi:hypothetical protein
MHTSHRYSPLGNMPLSLAPLVFSDLSYTEASRAPMGREQVDGVRFIAHLGRIFRAHS